MKSKELAYVAMFATLTAIGAFITIPLPMVPLTLQTFFVMLSGLMLGARLGALSQLFYLGMGAIGLPVFASGTSGLGVIAGPTGGFLIGFVVGSYLIGLATEGSTNPKRDGIAIAAGTAVIYVCGMAQLMNFTGMSIVAAAEVAILPFLPGDALKAILAISVNQKVRRANVLHI
ncbi:biotin transporter BioY [archaeon]|nr:MAG: biotin transporter BioY [archaeon]